LAAQVGGVVLVTVVVLAGQWAWVRSRTRQELAQAQEHGQVLAERLGGLGIILLFQCSKTKWGPWQKGNAKMRVLRFQKHEARVH
jgi:hypothetical protein